LQSLTNYDAPSSETGHVSLLPEVDESTVRLLCDNGLEKRYLSCVTDWRSRRDEISQVAENRYREGTQQSEAIRAQKEEFTQMVYHALRERLLSLYPYVQSFVFCDAPLLTRRSTLDRGAFEGDGPEIDHAIVHSTYCYFPL
jgi:hypothetical protein